MAVTTKKALCALHGKCLVGDVVSLIDSHGIRRIAVVRFQKFETNRVDIALLVLSEGEELFKTFVPIADTAVKLLDELYVFGRTTDPGAGIDTMTVVCGTGRVNAIQEGALIRSFYTGYDGLSGAGVVILEIIDNEFRLAGVHVATNDYTSSPPPIKKKKGNVADADSTSASTGSLARSIHGHIAYCLICEIQRVPELVSLLAVDHK